MWTDHYLAAKKCLAMYEAAMNAREWDVAQIKAQELRVLAGNMVEESFMEQNNADQQG